jgi:glyoxylase-like metal-dependent hydrolase (beta-lactamase superfamily II)
VHTPGHTPGHCAINFEGHGALFVGDAMCTRSPISGTVGPRVMPAFTNVDNRLAFESLAALEPQQAEVILPGHGEPWRGSPAQAVEEARRAPST